MTREELTAFVAGIATMRDLASRAADGLRAKLVQAPTRYSFAIEALDAIAEAGQSLIAETSDGSAT